MNRPNVFDTAATMTVLAPLLLLSSGQQRAGDQPYAAATRLLLQH